MNASRYISFLLVGILFHAAFHFAHAQEGFQVNVEKPKQYSERQLKAEKTGEGKLKTPKRILQNLTTRFNYYFNAATKFNEILDRAKEQHKDDYSQLLSFYNYDLNATAADSAQLDSVIYKCRSGIVHHDLRNEWIDELYLLWGAAWHLQKELDSASMMFQFINYAFAPKEDGFYNYIGTRKEGNQEISIATKEDKKFLHSNTFSRNNAFIWQIRTFIEREDYTSAGSLINTLKTDPAFPKRLHNALEEVEAYWHYKQKHWDSAAAHLAIAADGAGTRLEKARWEYLTAQLYERAGKTNEASKWYAKAISQTPDPVMEVYARLNVVRLSKEGGENAIDQNIAALLKMAKKDKYEDYRDIIYYMAAQMEMERNNVAAANELLIKGSKYNNGNMASRSKAFMQIADVSYEQKKYLQAAMFYDSVQVAEIPEADAQRVNERKPVLQRVVFNTGVISRQDSLQHIAALPPAEREDFINKQLKRLRKEQGLKEDVNTASSGQPVVNTSSATDLFSTQQKGEWYFYNSNLKAQGAAQFKAVWGNRPNVDNWRRSALINRQVQINKPVTGKDPNSPNINNTGNNDLSFEGLLSKLPTTPEALKVSNDSIRNALFNLGSTYLNEINDYPSAINSFEELRRRFPDDNRMDEVLFNLYFAYTKAGNATTAAQVKKLLQDKYPSSRYTAIATTGKDPLAKASVSPEATKDYENIYNLFIEGKFEEALTAKQIADSTYKTNFWQPQLLYIEAVYRIKQREDSVAKNLLQTIINQNTNKALSTKAQNLMNVLSRRRQIEDELTQLQIQRPADDTTTNQPVIVQPPVVRNDTAVKKPLVVNPPKDTTSNKPKDLVVNKPISTKPVDTVTKNPVIPRPNSVYTFVPDAAHSAVVILDKVDPIFAGEAKNAFFRYNKEKYYNLPLEVQTINLTADTKLLLISNFPTAQAAADYVTKAKPLAASEILPWLAANKYSFTIVSAPNLEILKTTTDINAYKKFLEQHLKL